LLMPRMDGITLCKEVRKVHGPGSLPILFLTALSETGQVEAGFLAGGNDYITKPFSRESLLARVGFHLDTVRNCCAREELLLARVEETRALIEEYEAKYGERRLDEEQAQVLLDAVRRLMEEERIWQDPLLSMKRVARKLQMKQADLSQVLNDRLGQNFHSFVNGYRVSHVCDRLRDRADCGVTILEIAFDAGFSSKSAFHVQFKQVTGMTPSEFRKKHAKL
ncbi:helix-turn-helix domain-containing protein, partial [Myxococcota bacterium]|nr:helix-turn-helix domain-containing protein [Myxococcota bacterium]